MHDLPSQHNIVYVYVDCLQWFICACTDYHLLAYIETDCSCSSN